jgi:ABC-type multidrug transport system fused ATPase/permease subunit
VLDELTSKFDMKTATLIQKLIKQNFESITIITVTHRLRTIAHYVRVFVMEKRRIVEEWRPIDRIDSKKVHF